MKRLPTYVSLFIFLWVTHSIPYLWTESGVSVCYAKEQKRAVPVEVINPTRRSMETYVKITGTCYSTERSTYGAKIDGTIIEIFADEGHRVRKGQVLAKLEETDHALSLKLAELEYVNAKSQVEKSKAELEKARVDMITKKADFERLNKVYIKDSLSKQQLDFAKNSYEIAQATFNQARIGLEIFENQVTLLETRVKIAEKKLSDCKIRAPFGGVISVRHANLGEWVKAGEPVFTLEADNPIEVKGHISEIYLTNLKIGMPVRVTIDGVNHLPGSSRGYETKLTEIASVADPRQRTVEVTVQIENSNHLLKPGLFARMDVILKRATGALVIPEACIIKGHNSPRVFIIKENRAEMREIETGIREDEMIEVISGLQMDSQVVIAGKDQLVGDASVKIQKREAK